MASLQPRGEGFGGENEPASHPNAVKNDVGMFISPPQEVGSLLALINVDVA